MANGLLEISVSHGALATIEKLIAKIESLEIKLDSQITPIGAKGKEKTTFTVSEAADLLNVTGQTIRNMCRQKLLPHVRLGTKGDRIVLPAKALNEWIATASKNGARAADTAL